MLESELSSALGRARYARPPGRLADASEPGPQETGAVAQRVFGHRNGHRDRELMGTFGKTTISVPRARLETFDGGTAEWKSKSLSAYSRRTKEVESLIAGSYLAGTNTRRVGRALASLFRGAVSKDTVSRVWRKIKGDWEAWNKRDVSTENVIRLILDGTTVRVRIDRKATTISLLIVLGIRRDGQKVLLAIRSMGGESEAAWRTVLDDLAARGLRKPELAIVDGAPGLEKALTSLWSDIPIQRCTVHKLRDLIAHAPKKLAEEIAADFSDMIYAKTAKEVATRRKAFIRKWRLKCRAVADSLEEAGDKLFTFIRLPVAQWKSVRTTNAIERLHEEFKRRIKTQTVLPSAETAAMLFWGLLASGQITMRKVDGWETLEEQPTDLIDLAA
jgi:putative transposase